ncbi:hypothetical protein [Hydrogenophaga sp. RWCD_12]|uniref:hypothetical protein n=1 Tax=Hydrogenophaga sp. RWCD_12 TaxID=3391190 RepID=UPI003984F4D6
MSVHTRTGPMRVALILLALATAGLANAAQASTAKPGKKAPSTSVRFIDAPSSESPAAREKRLRRECQGRANAGACLGYTR